MSRTKRVAAATAVVAIAWSLSAGLVAAGTGGFSRSPGFDASASTHRTTGSFAAPLVVEYRTPEEEVSRSLITSVTVRFGPSGTFTPPAGCVPTPLTFEDGDAGVTTETFVESPTTTTGTSQPRPPVRGHRFSVESVAATFPCNGSYEASVSAVLDRQDTSTSTTRPTSVDTGITQAIGVFVTPKNLASAPIVEYDDESDVVVIDWQPSPTAPPDLQYVLERRTDPEGEFRALGVTEQTATVDVPDVGGEIEYRVRTRRPGPGSTGGEGDDFLVSSADGAKIATVTVPEPDPDATTTTVKPPPVGSEVTLPSLPDRRPATPTVPTTIDTGFDPELDFGRPPTRPGERAEFGDDELSGATIVREDDGFTPRGLVKPAAAALVLAGWAIHLIRLSRLAAA